ncbi:hypothetical protein [Antarctobacter heliothermus]|uniref:Periplasmic protein n=1 Tax=Antarctobacter heliothermus TaxID=74033 RepID=A0A239B6C7_9RHOB|nr:hypothetical protein [Antarctobacter heliothermus]SNS03232.1 hypothetical protein SAMN04488078_100289 [Antarctobacter heliothermus]
MKILTLAATVALMATAAMATPMQFQSHNNGNCTGCSWTSAEGEITQDTPDRLREFLVQNPYARDLVFHSPGGNLGAALELGRIIRENDMSTGIGRTDPAHPSDYGPMLAIVDGTCESACAFAFLGGTSRSAYETDEHSMVPRTGRLGMHQFYSLDGAEIPTAATQQIMGQVLFYVLEMGINAELLSIASSTPPDDMRFLSRKELVDLKVLTASSVSTPDLVLAGDDLAVEWQRFWETGDLEKTTLLYCRSDTQDWMIRTRQHWLSGEPKNETYTVHAGNYDLPFFVQGQQHPMTSSAVTRYERIGTESFLDMRLPIDPRDHPDAELQIYPINNLRYPEFHAAEIRLPDAATLNALGRACRP